MHRGRIVIVVAAVAAAAALLFPFFSAPTIGDVREAAHLLPFAALVIASAVAVAGDRGERLTGLPAVAATAAIVAASFLAAAIWTDAVLAGGDATSLGLETSIGTGLWLTMIACGIAVIGLGVSLTRRLS